MMRLMQGLRIKILDFVHAVFEGPGETVFDLRQERDELRYIDSSLQKEHYGRSLQSCSPRRIYTLKDFQTLLYPILTSHKSLHNLKLPGLAALSFLHFLDTRSVFLVKEVVGVTSCELATLTWLLASFGIHNSAIDSWELWRLDCERLKFMSDGNSSIAEHILLYWIGIQIS